MNFIALRIIPEAHLGVSVIAVYCGQFVGVTLSSVHAVLSQKILIAGISVEEESKPKHQYKLTGGDIFNRKCLGKVGQPGASNCSSYLLLEWRWVVRKLCCHKQFLIISPEKILHGFPHPDVF